MIKEVYNPEIHCCERWDKDFCNCIKEAAKDRRWNKKAKDVNSVLKFLEKNKIKFSPSSTINVVLVDTNEQKLLVSLRPENGLIKVRYNGNGKWYTFSRSKFLEKHKTYA